MDVTAELYKRLSPLSPYYNDKKPNVYRLFIELVFLSMHVLYIVGTFNPTLKPL